MQSMDEATIEEHLLKRASRVYRPTLEDLALWKFQAQEWRDPEGFLETRYRNGRHDFESYAGPIADDQEWWGSTNPGGIVVTDRTAYRRHVKRRDYGLQLHRSTGLVTADFPECEPLLAMGDDLARRACEVLRGSPQRVVVGRLFGHATALLDMIEATTRRKNEDRDIKAMAMSEEEAGSRVRTAAKRYASELRNVEAYYNRTAMRSAQLDYFSGVARGVIWVAVIIGVAVLVADRLLRWSEIVVPAGTYASLIAAVVAGAIGSCVSVMWRMSTGDFVSDYEAGSEHLRMIGVFRPLIGATFGLAIFFAVQADLASFGNDDPDFWLLTFIAFLSGFSERFAPNVFGRIEGEKTPAPQAQPEQHPQLVHASEASELAELVSVEGDTTEPSPSSQDDGIKSSTS